MQKRIEDAIHRLDFKNDNQAFNKLNQLKAMSICADALINLAHRYAQLAEELAGKEEDVVRKKELLTIAEVCRQVPAHAPRNFRKPYRCTGLCISG